MNKERNFYLRVVQLLLCLFVLAFVGCSGLREVEGKGLQNGENILQLSVNENDFVGFNQTIQELGLVAVDFRPAVTNVKDSDHNQFWITFRFGNEAASMRNYVSLMSNGDVRRISYPYQ